MKKLVKELHCRSLNLPAWILVLNSVAVGLSWQLLFNIIFSLIRKPEADSCFEAYPGETKLYIVIAVQYVVFPVLFPITGWLADTKFGRGKVIKLSLWFCWIGALVQCVSYCIQYGTCGLPVNIAKYGISSVSLLLLAIGVASFLSNILAYGLDQLVYKGNTNIRAFVHWIVWGWFIGESTSYIAHVSCSIYDSKLIMVTAFISFAVISIVLCFSICFEHKFLFSGVLRNNPYHMVYVIVMYAIRHNEPQNRSSLTFWENEVPTRLDLGKEKYGGPFVEEKVENVKMLGRVLLILLSTFGFYTTYYVTVVDVDGRHNYCDGNVDLNHYIPFIYFSSLDKLILVIIPLLELLIYPLFPKLEYFCINSLRSFGIAYIAMLLSLTAISIIKVVVQHDPNGIGITDDDYFVMTRNAFLYYFVPYSLSGIADGLSLIFVFEFICSQVPVDMSGMLSGFFWFIRGSFISIGKLLQYPFSASEKCRTKHLSCSLWIPAAIEMVLCILGFVLYIYMVWKYKKRKKETEYDVHRVIEDTYTRILNNSNRNLHVSLNSGNDYNLLFQDFNPK